MNPTITDVPLPRPESFLTYSEDTPSLLPAISPLTLAFFADSGWYDVDFALASPSSGPWGRGAGCPFVNEKCVMGNGGVVRAANSGYFCDAPKALLSLSSTDETTSSTVSSGPGFSRGSLHADRDDLVSQASQEDWTGCTPDMLRKATCGLGRYSKALPEEYAYFKSSQSFLKKMSASEAATVAGTDPYLDYCPIYDAPVSSDANEDITLCTSPKAARYSRIKEMEFFGSGSRCVTGRIDGKKSALCVSVACVLADQSLRVKVDGKWTKCQFAGQVLDMWPRVDKIICPDIRLVCPTFHCPRDCLGAGGVDKDGNTIDGICDAETGQCMCQDVSEAPSTAPSAQPAPVPTGSGDEEYDEEYFLEETPSADTNGNNETDSSNTNFLPPYEVKEEAAIRYIPCKRAYPPSSDALPWMEPPLSDIYVKRAKELVDTPVDIFTRTFRVFASMDTGDVIGFLAVSVVVVSMLLGAGIGGMGVVKAYKRKKRGRTGNFAGDAAVTAMNRRRPAVDSPSSLRLTRPGLNTVGIPGVGVPRFRLTLGSTDTQRARRSSNRADQRRQRSSRQRPRNAFRANKDKAVATMLVDLRINDPARKRRQRRRELMTQRQERRRREIQERVRHLPARVSSQAYSSTGESVVRHSDLPPLPQGGRVVAVVGALFIDDVPDEDATSTNADDTSLPGTDTSEHVTNTTTCDATLSSFGGTNSASGRMTHRTCSDMDGSDAGSNVDNNRSDTARLHADLGNRGIDNMAFQFSSGAITALRKRKDRRSLRS